MHQALLLTFVVTATSRLPIKGSKSSQTSTNTTRRVDLSGLYKDPFFQALHTAVHSAVVSTDPFVQALHSAVHTAVHSAVHTALQ